jgi:actin-related protein 3
LLTLILTNHEVVLITLSDAVNSVQYSDVLLIQNLIFTSDSLKQTESWLPICLTGISDAGYLQMYCNFFEPNFGVIFITESQENSYFMRFCNQSREIYEVIYSENFFLFTSLN